MPMSCGGATAEWRVSVLLALGLAVLMLSHGLVVIARRHA